MAPMASQSMRYERTSGGNHLGSSTRSSRSIPIKLETVTSEDSSVFGGLDNIPTPRDGPPAEISTTRKIQAVRFHGEQSSSAITRPTLSGSRSASTTSTQQSYLRNMKPMTDNDSAFDSESMDLESDRYNSTKHSQPSNRRRSSERYGQSSNLYGQDVQSPASYTSVNSFVRPQGSFNMVCQVDYCDPVPEDEVFPRRPGNEERITTMLEDYEKQMEATLESLTLDDDDRDDVLMDRDYLSEIEDIMPRRVRPDNAHQTITSEQSTKLQKVLHQARTEVEVLKDNNEQLLSEIEQQEEEYRSEKKLFQERTRQKINDLKNLYQEEMENLIREKDAAIVEAGRQAARYGESGRKQIASLKSQLEKVKSQANSVVRQKIEEAIKAIHTKKEEEFSARLGALRKSYETEFEKLTDERERHVQRAVNEAVASCTKKLLADREQQLNDKMRAFRKELEMEKENAIQSTNQSLVMSRNEVSALKQEREGFAKTLEAIKESIGKQYPSQMKEFSEKSRETSGPFKLFQDQQKSSDKVESLFKEVVESFGFLLDKSSKKIVSYDLVEIEDLKKIISDQEEQIDRQRQEINLLKKETETDKGTIRKLEASLETAEDEKKTLERYQRESDNRWDGIQKIHSADEVFQQMEKRRNTLAEAMAIGQLELANTKAQKRSHFLKPVDHFQPRISTPVGCDSAGVSIGEGHADAKKHMETSSIHAPVSVDEVLDETSIQTEQSRRSANMAKNKKKEKKGDARYESPAKKKSYAILRSFKSSQHQRSPVPQEDGGEVEQDPETSRKALTRAQKIRGYFESRKQEDGSSHTFDSLTDESMSSLRTNTGGKGAKAKETLVGVTDGGKPTRQNGRAGNPLGMFAAAKKDNADVDEQGESDRNSVDIPSPPLHRSSGTATRAVQNRGGSSEEARAPLKASLNTTNAPISFKKKRPSGFSQPSPAHVLNGKKPSLDEYEGETMTTATCSGISQQENTVPISIAVKSESKKSQASAGASGHTMCLRPLSVGTSEEEAEDNVSILSGNNSLSKTSTGGSEPQQRMRSFQTLTDGSNEYEENDDDSGDPFVTTETMSSDRCSTSRYSCSASDQPRPMEMQRHSNLVGREKRASVISPTSEATTAVVSHQYKANIGGLCNKYGNNERRSVRVARVASNFPTRVRARVNRRPGAT
eukprot:scaffold13207_cov143-Cylindrotheca_fusiformis.AAC.7